MCQIIQNIYQNLNETEKEAKKWLKSEQTKNMI